MTVRRWYRSSAVGADDGGWKHPRNEGYRLGQGLVELPCSNLPRTSDFSPGPLHQAGLFSSHSPSHLKELLTSDQKMTRCQQLPELQKMHSDDSHIN